jgi:hypothetical protein
LEGGAVNCYIWQYPVALDPVRVKTKSESVIRKLGGQVCDWLPVLGETAIRTQEQLVGRSLVMNALLNVYFKAPISVVSDWIARHGLQEHLSDEERKLLNERNDELSEQERTNLYWYIEALWALMWAGALAFELNPALGVPETMASLTPNLQRKENGAKFSEKMQLRPYVELFEMLDLYYRLHWWARDGVLNGYSTAPVSHDIILERRKALEWLLDSTTNWDRIELST